LAGRVAESEDKGKTGENHVLRIDLRPEKVYHLISKSTGLINRGLKKSNDEPEDNQRKQH
jgi:hypothetical protein